MGTSNQKSSLETKVLALINGFTNDMPSTVTSLTVLGQSTAITAVVAELQSIESTLSAVDTARSALSVAIADRTKAMPTSKAYVESVVAALKVQFEGNTQQLTAFGVTPPKPRKSVSGETRVIATAKAAATRAARGTKGKKQAQQISATPLPSVTVNGLGATPPSSSSGSGEEAAPASTTTAPAAAAK